MLPYLFAKNVRSRLVRIACRLMQLPRIIIYELLSSGCVVGRPIRNQPLQTAGLGIIEFKERVNIGVFQSPFFLSSYAYIEARNITSRISIGDSTWINNGFSAIAEHSSITIGNRVLIGTNMEIFDSDFHAIRFAERGKSNFSFTKPVVIEDDVFLGSNVRVLKGVTIGKGSVIANGSIVVKDIPSGVVAGGNPAQIIKTIK